MILRKIFVFLFSFVFLLLIPPDVNAQQEFVTDINVEYQFSTSGTTKVIHEVSLENVFSNLYATSYKLYLNNIDPILPKAFQDGTELNLTKYKEKDSTVLNVEFSDAVVGKGQKRNFTIEFENNSFATRTGEVWEVSIPKLSQENNFRSYNVILNVPSSFGNEAYISPKANEAKDNGDFKIYSFSKEKLLSSGITAGFGAFQVFSFNFNYHLENPLNRSAITEIALPPDTNLQKVYYTDLKPEPDNVYVDPDGNWIGEYKLEPRQRIDVQAKGFVQIFATARPFPKSSKEVLQNNLKPTQYWQTEHPQIAEIAAKYKTPKEIYDFVWQNLSYDYDNVKPNVERKGAVLALNNPNSAICMEFTDLFVAIARAAGIPAREINGYAYTENPQIQPLSLVADVLHAWPEYWDEKSESWIAVDPTWASTTGGVDFFSKLDLRHFAFVIHGNDPSKPYPPGSYKLGSNPQKDVFISFGQLPQEKQSALDIKVKPLEGLPFMNSKVEVTIRNPGPSALYNLEPQILFDGKFETSGFIEILPPFSTHKMSVSIPFSFLGSNTPGKVTVLANGREATIITDKNKTVIYNMIIISIVFFAAIILLLVRLGKIKIGVIIAKISKVFKGNNDKKPLSQDQIIQDK